MQPIMNTPSIETIMERLAEPLRKPALINPKRAARLIKAYMMGANTASQVGQVMDAINEILGGYGVEAIRDNKWDSYYCDIGVLYVNMGDTYVPTVIYDTRKGAWMVCSWGDLVEAQPKRFK
jgi:hypothetical protein